MAFDRLDPIGAIRGDLQIARLCEVVAWAVGAKGLTMDDFLLKFDSETQPKRKPVKMSGDMLKMIFTMGGETVIDKRPGHGGSR